MAGVRHTARRRRGLRFAVLALALAASVAIAAPVPASAAQTVVSLEFDHNMAHQWPLVQVLDEYGVKGTFFVNSGNVGRSPDYLTWDQLAAMYAEGHEIGGHTLTHANPATLTPEEQRTEVCDDRQNLLDHGFAATDFAYPYGSDAISEAIVQGCGYASGRALTSLRFEGCPNDCPIAETIPPRDLFRTRTARGIRSFDVTPLSELQHYVTQAEAAGGGWVQLVYNCFYDCSVPPDELRAFLDWLTPRAANGTVTKTVQQVVGGTLQPSPAGGPPPPPPPGSGIAVAPRDTVAPIIARFTLRRRTFAVARQATPLVARTRRAKRGTVFAYVLSEPGTVTFSIDRLLPGRRVGRTCRRPSRRLSRARRCTRALLVSRLTRNAARLSNRTRFTGRIGRRTLRPGRYRVTARAVDGAGNRSAPRRATFAVVRR